MVVKNLFPQLVSAHIDVELIEEKSPTIKLRSGKKVFSIGMNGRYFFYNWAEFVRQHKLQIGNILVFLPDGKKSFMVIIFSRLGFERLYPWHYKF